MAGDYEDVWDGKKLRFNRIDISDNKKTFALPSMAELMEPVLRQMIDMATTQSSYFPGTSFATTDSALEEARKANGEILVCPEHGMDVGLDSASSFKSITAGMPICLKQVKGGFGVPDALYCFKPLEKAEPAVDPPDIDPEVEDLFDIAMGLK